MEMYLFLFALVCVFPFAPLLASSSFLLFPPPLLPVSAGLSALDDWRWPFMLRGIAMGDMGVIGESTR